MPPALDQDPVAWSGAADGYAREFAPVTAPYADDALDLLGVGPATELLDVGAGSGVLSLAAARRGANVVATDFAPGMVAALRARADAESDLSGRIDTAVMDGQALDLDNGRFDAAASMFGLIFFPDVDAGARELARVVRPGGSVAIGAWRVAGFRLMALNAIAVAEALGTAVPEPPPQTWARIGDEGGMDALLRTAGLVDVAVHVVTKPFAPDDPEAFFRRQPEWSPPAQPLFATLDAATINRAAAAFARLVHREEALAFDALIGVGRVA